MRNALCLMTLLVSSLAIAATERPGDKFVQPLGIHLLVDGIDQVLQTFGAAPVTTEEHHARAVCYLWPTAVTKYAIGDEGIDARFELSQRSASPPANCIAIKESASGTALDIAGLHLGMKEADFIAAVGNDTAVKDGWRVAQFSWLEQVAMKSGRMEVGLYVDVSVEGKFTDGLLTDLLIWKSAST